MEKEKLRALQLVQMTIMDDIHRVCIEHNLRYYLIGGSALGAIRHKGFIPWDVDIDIAMPRNDYESFIMKYSKELPNGLCCVDYRTDKDYYSPHALVYMKGSKLVQKDDYLNPQFKRYGIFVDILPLDQCPNEKEKWEKQKRQIKKWTTLRYRKLSLVYSTNSLMERFFKRIYRGLFLWLPMSYINKRQSQVMQLYDKMPDIECKYWCSMASHYSFDKLTMPKEYFGNPKLMVFEDREYYVPEQVENYLTHLFGDYMRQPSKESQEEQMKWFIEAQW